MEVECNFKGWISKLRNNTNCGPNKKVQQNAKDTLQIIQKLDPNILLRKHYSRRGGSKKNILLATFKDWNAKLAPAKRNSRVVDKVTKLEIKDNVLDSPLLSTEEKCSGYRNIVYRFPTNAKLTPKEQVDLRLILKQDLNKEERVRVIKTLKEVHERDKQKRT